MSRYLWKRWFSQRRRRLLAITLVLMGLAMAVLFAVSGWLVHRHPSVRYQDVLQVRAMDVLVIAWFIFVGTSLGSFINVVVWRMPQGLSINGRSFCPRCHRRLTWKDNWPVLGWLALGGRCRTCRLPISIRYPMVEAVVGLCVLAIFSSQFFSEGRSLPYQAASYRGGGPLWSPRLSFHVMQTMIYHVVVITVLWAAALIRFDGVRLPSKLIRWSLLLTIVPILIQPSLAVVPWRSVADITWRADGQWLNAMARIITGLATAILIARTLSRVWAPTADPKLDPLGEGTARFIDLATILAIPAVAVGWQAMFALTLLAVLIACVLQRTCFQGKDALACFAIASPITLCAQLVGWRLLNETAFWTNVDSSPTTIIVVGLLILVSPYLLKVPRKPSNDLVVNAVYDV